MMTTGLPAAGACATCGKFMSSGAKSLLTPQRSIVAWARRPTGATDSSPTALRPSKANARTEYWRRASTGGDLISSRSTPTRP